MVKVYTVAGGERDAFKTVAVFSTPEKRDAFFEKYNQAEYAECKDFDLDPEWPELTPLITLVINKDGSVDKLGLGWQMEGFCSMFPAGFDGFGGWADPKMPSKMFYRVETSDKEMAISEAKAALNQVLAANAWADWDKARDVLSRWTYTADK